MKQLLDKLIVQLEIQKLLLASQLWTHSEPTTTPLDCTLCYLLYSAHPLVQVLEVFILLQQELCQEQ